MLSLYDLFIGFVAGLLFFPFAATLLTDFLDGLSQVFEGEVQKRQTRFAVYCLMAAIGVLMFVYL